MIASIGSINFLLVFIHIYLYVSPFFHYFEWPHLTVADSLCNQPLKHLNLKPNEDLFHFNLSIVSFYANLKFPRLSRPGCWTIVIEHDIIDNKNGIKLKCCKMYNISLITIEICH